MPPPPLNAGGEGVQQVKGSCTHPVRRTTRLTAFSSSMMSGPSSLDTPPPMKLLRVVCEGQGPAGSVGVAHAGPTSLRPHSSSSTNLEDPSQTGFGVIGTAALESHGINISDAWSAPFARRLEVVLNCPTAP